MNDVSFGLGMKGTDLLVVSARFKSQHVGTFAMGRFHICKGTINDGQQIHVHLHSHYILKKFQLHDSSALVSLQAPALSIIMNKWILWSKNI